MAIPHFPFYPTDWLGDPHVLQLTLEEEGAYIRLLAAMWASNEDCSLPNSDRILAGILRIGTRKFRTLRKTLIDGDTAVFTIREDGRITNKRLKAEWDKALERSAKAKDAAGERWSGNADAMQTHSECNADAMQTHSEGNATRARTNAISISKIKNPLTHPPRRKRPGADERVGTVLARYDELFQRHFGRRPVIQGGRDGKLIKTIPKDYSADDICRAMELWFARRDERFVWRGGDIPSFVAVFNRLITADGADESPPVPDEREFAERKNRLWE